MLVKSINLLGLCLDFTGAVVLVRSELVKMFSESSILLESFRERRKQQSASIIGVTLPIDEEVTLRNFEQRAENHYKRIKLGFVLLILGFSLQILAGFVGMYEEGYRDHPTPISTTNLPQIETGTHNEEL